MWSGFGLRGARSALLRCPLQKLSPYRLSHRSLKDNSSQRQRQRPKSTRSSTPYRYRTGYEYSVTGTNVAPDGPIAPMSLVTTTNSLDGVTSVWRGLDPASKPSWKIVNEAATFSFSETLQGPGLIEHTIITRETDIESLNETLSTFTE